MTVGGTLGLTPASAKPPCGDASEHPGDGLAASQKLPVRQPSSAAGRQARNMNFKALRAFQLIAERGSLSAAASDLCLSQPAVSRLIAMLESELDLRLFDRTGRGLTMTHEGKLFFDATKHILAGVDEIPRIAGNIRSGEQQFHLLTTQRIAQAVVSPALSVLRSENAGLHCSIDLRSQLEFDNAMSTVRYDLAIASLPLGSTQAPIEIKPLFKVLIEVVLPREHPLALHNRLTAAELANETLIGPWRNPLWRQQMDAILPSGLPSPGRTVETHSALMAYQMASDGAGIAFLDRLSARGLDTSNVVFRPLAPSIWTTFGYMHQSAKPLGRNAHLFIDAVRQTISAFRMQNHENANSAALIFE